MKNIIKVTTFAILLLGSVIFASCKENKQNAGEVDSMEATRPDGRDTDVTVEPDNGIEMDTMTRTGSDTIATP